jgi:hypothetical protein
MEEDLRLHLITDFTAANNYERQGGERAATFVVVDHGPVSDAHTSGLEVGTKSNSAIVNQDRDQGHDHDLTPDQGTTIMETKRVEKIKRKKKRNLHTKRNAIVVIRVEAGAEAAVEAATGIISIILTHSQLNQDPDLVVTLLKQLPMLTRWLQERRAGTLSGPWCTRTTAWAKKPPRVWRQ